MQIHTSVKLKSHVQVLFGRHTKRNDSTNTQLVTIQELLNPTSDFYRANSTALNDGTYLFPAIPQEGSRRIARESLNEEGVHCGFLAFDFDLNDHTAGWDSQTQAKKVLRSIFSCWPQAKNACVIATTKGGVRVLFRFSHFLKPSQWQFIHDQLEQEFFDSMQYWNKRNERTHRIDHFVKIKGTVLKVDRRTPVLLTRLPYGFRDGKDVTKQDYFVAVKGLTDNILEVDINTPDADLSPSNLRRGYVRDPLKYCEVPDLTNVKIPLGLKSFTWSNGTPQPGERDTAIFLAVSRLIGMYLTTLTPEEYLKILEKALNELDENDNGLTWLHTGWTKIRSNWVKKNEAKTLSGRSIAKLQEYKTGGVCLFADEDFDNILMADKVYKSAKKYSDKLTKQVAEHKEGILFLNTPPGARKSACAKSAMIINSHIFYICPDRNHMQVMTSHLQKNGIKVNTVYSYECMIERLKSKVYKEKLFKEYLEYMRLRPVAEKLKRNGGNPQHPLLIKYGKRLAIKPFTQYALEVFEHDEKLVDVLNIMISERRANIQGIEKGKRSILTLKMARIISNALHKSPEDTMIIVDEAKPIDFVDPIKFIENNTVTISGKEIELHNFSNMDDRIEQENFYLFMSTRPAILINADRGLKETLQNNGYGKINTIGQDMPAVFDVDLNYVICPDLSSGYLEYKERNVTKWGKRKDNCEYDRRAEIVDSLTTMKLIDVLADGSTGVICNGKRFDGSRIAGNNIVTATGSNKYINKHVASIILPPTLIQLAESIICTGLTVMWCKKQIIENAINQMVSRNTGWRCFEAIEQAEINEYSGEKLTRKNSHYCYIPEYFLNYDLNLIVRTTNVYTHKSNNTPVQATSGIRPRSIAFLAKRELLKIAPGEVKSVAQMFTVVKKLNKKAIYNDLNSAISDLLDDNFDKREYSDFTLHDQKVLKGKRTKNCVFREAKVESVIEGTLKNNKRIFTVNEVAKIVQKIIKGIPINVIKEAVIDQAPLYDYTLLIKQRNRLLIPQDSEEFFPK